MNRQLLQEAHDAIEAFTDPQGHMPEDTGEFRDLSKVLVNLKAALSQPTPQGVAEVMHLVEKYASDTADFVLVGSPLPSCEPIEQAITSLIAERDALKARVAELERDPKAKTERMGPVGQPYGIVDPDYARVFTQARIVAWQYGYACVMHGSFTRDLDLLLVPWNEQARDNSEQLMKLIAQGCGLRFSDGKEDVVYSTVKFTDKPHGRKSCSLYFPQFGDRRWIDISIAPITPPALVTERDTPHERGAELERDAARIDWLEAQINENGALHLHDGNDAYGLGLGLRTGRSIRSLRKAIDDASKEAK